jgi:putative alpha-1,2-mannosidase
VLFTVLRRDDASIVTVRIATSLISESQADLNFKRELPLSRGFDDLAAEAKSVWHK